MTVLDNLQVGAYLLTDKVRIQGILEKVFELFPILKKLLKQISGTLSGGEQQMLAIGRAFMSNPELLCIDEPSTGLAPLIRQEVFEKISEIKSMGITILRVEQDASSVFKLSSRNYLFSKEK